MQKNIYQFGRYLRICYDLQTKTNLAPPGANLPYTEETPVPENHPAPIIHTKHTQKETPILPKTQNIKSKKKKQPINRQPESATPITHQPTQHQPITPTDIQQPTKPANTPTIRNNEDEIFPQNNHLNDQLTANPHNTTNNNTTSNSHLLRNKTIHQTYNNSYSTGEAMLILKETSKKDTNFIPTSFFESLPIQRNWRRISKKEN